MSRGRLIHPFLAEIARLDTRKTARDPDMAGPLTSGYDDVFMEPELIPPPANTLGAVRGEDARKEHKPILIPCQVEVENFEFLQTMLSARTPGNRIAVILHFRDLERLRLIDPVTKEALIRVNDRLISVRRKWTRKVLQAFENPPGLFATEVRPISWGLSSAHRNLLLVLFEDREQSVRSTG